MADNIEPISHLEKVITGDAEPISHLEQIIALYGGTGGSGGSGTTNYNALLNKPSINGVELRGNKTLADLGITNYDDTQIKTDISEVNKKIEELKSVKNIEYNGESVICNNTLASRTSDMLIKGKTYINLGTGEIESAGEKENKISILSNNNKSADDVNYKEYKKEILLPIKGGLKSLPNGICDTIEQRTDGVYLVQKIDKYDIKEDDTIKTDSPPNQQNTIAFSINVNARNIKTSGNNICNNFNRFTSGDLYWNNDKEGIINSSNSQFKFRILKSKLSTQDIAGIKAWLKANPRTVCYETNTPVETKLDINNLDLEVHKDITYVTTDNAIQPTLSFKVPSNIGGVIQSN